MALDQKKSRLFVVILVLVMVGLALLATVLINNGMNDEDLQEHLESLEER